MPFYNNEMSLFLRDVHLVLTNFQKPTVALNTTVIPEEEDDTIRIIAGLHNIDELDLHVWGVIKLRYIFSVLRTLFFYLYKVSDPKDNGINWTNRFKKKYGLATVFRDKILPLLDGVDPADVREWAYGLDKIINAYLLAVIQKFEFNLLVKGQLFEQAFPSTKAIHLQKLAKQNAIYEMWKACDNLASRGFFSRMFEVDATAHDPVDVLYDDLEEGEEVDSDTMSVEYSL